MKDNEFYMQQALNLAKKGMYEVGNNPMVGCIIVKNNQIIAKGYHQKYGENHAEINALEQINFNAKDCEIFITLEPCSHFGKTPPCVNAIIQAQPKKVIIASTDDSLKISSRQIMQNAKIKVISGILEKEARELNRGFNTRITTGLPFLTCKIASSLDGRTAMADGQSKWITSKEVKNDVFYLRAKNRAIITGSGTILKDNPSMNVRIDNLSSPIKVVMDRRGKITNKNLNIFSGEKTIISDETPEQVLKMLGDMSINYCLLEAGNTLNSAFLNLIDELIIYQAPIIMGQSAKPMFAKNITTMTDKISLTIKQVKQIGVDIKTIYEFN